METNIQRICHTNRHQGWFSCFMEKYEETVNNRDRAMTFGRLWENSSPAPITVTLVQEHKKIICNIKKVACRIR